MFQSIYTYKRRWNSFSLLTQDVTIFVSIHLYLQEALEYGCILVVLVIFSKFQSIYTYKRRWNCIARYVQLSISKVSIHLYLQEALEFSSHSFAVVSITPFQSIYTYKRRWNLMYGIGAKDPLACFNPFIPTRGVGI